jgi:hypothetical protein
VERGLLSLAICKPKIRTRAEPGDVIFGFTANSLDPKNCLIYIAKLTDKAHHGEYFRLRKYARRRDCIFKMRGNRFEWKKGAVCHGPDDLVHDLGSSPDYPKAEVLLSDDFDTLAGKELLSIRSATSRSGKPSRHSVEGIACITMTAAD